MNSRLVGVLAATLLTIACGSGPESDGEGSSLAGMLPDDSTLPGWRTADGPITYDPVTLYEYLNGGAPLYLDFGFVELAHVRYQLGDDAMSSVTLDVYDMGSEAGAFGLFRSARPLDAEVREWGAEGYRSGPIAATWKGRISIHAQADDERPELIDTMEQLIAAVANEVEGESSPPPMISLLPAEGLVPWSERIVAKDLMSHEFLPGGVVAEYRVSDDRGSVFFSELGDRSAATEAIARLRAHHQEWGETVGEIESIGGGGFRFTDPGLGAGAVVSSGRFVVGVHGDLPDDVQIGLLTHLARNLESLENE